MSEPWFARAFRGEYLQVYAHRSPQQARAQVSAMQSCGLLPRAGQVLDIACGAGRHLHAMREAGLDARGLDYSIDLLRAGALAGQAVRADMRAMPFGEEQFDWACSLFTSFGYFEGPQDDLRVFRGAARALRPGGCMVIDHMNPVVTVRELQAETVEVRDGLTIRARRRLEDQGRRVCKDITLERRGGTENWSESVRLYQPIELQALLGQAGMRVLRRCGDLDGRPWDETSSPRQVVLAHRP